MHETQVVNKDLISALDKEVSWLIIPENTYFPTRYISVGTNTDDYCVMKKGSVGYLLKCQEDGDSSKTSNGGIMVVVKLKSDVIDFQRGGEVDGGWREWNLK